ncbi:poly-beta-1,6-N-acetyl-D-glucosamine synthase [bacterium BMS3Bbin12]|nr:poly-beta-1,6-N-acetyl-D-glucosamine synthase [bacterium BMS3Abin12]GBE47734.1 poly-beta-1,6-N-acetyl-D-glucosamine synthase [bacterium BMS3Bbin12]GBE49267.1 poly-beta-1,6-N-acetyl-D-glucosamine synthase [bacterium BMS3Bbin13]
MNETVRFLAAVQHTDFYIVTLVFFAVYPIFTSVVWMTTSSFFWFRREKDSEPLPLNRTPMVSVLIAAHNEEDVIGRALEAACTLDYPALEVVVVDDGSTDATAAVVREYVGRGRARLIRKEENEGKALALNDALPCLNGEIVLIMDADAEPQPQSLRYMVPHFESPRVAAVTGNPRVYNVGSLLCRLQLIEFTSIVSLLRRSQRVWGRILTVSGVVTAFRKSALTDVGGFSPDMPTEDIDLTWKLQKRFWDVRYEPNAVLLMRVPSTFRGLVKQRLRWAHGLMQVLRRHHDVILGWRYRRLWPVFIEAVLSTIWAVCFVILTILWIVSYSVGYPPVGAHPIPNLWGMLIATFALIQILIGTLMDRRYDPETLHYYPYAVFYPIIYWMIMSITTVIALPALFRHPARRPVRWDTERDSIRGEGP